MICKELTEAEFKGSIEGKPRDVTSNADPVVDIWPYVKEVQNLISVPEVVIENQSVEYVWRSQFNHYDHVLIPLGKKNVFLVIVVDRIHASVWGHRLLDLNVEYGF